MFSSAIMQPAFMALPDQEPAPDRGASSAMFMVGNPLSSGASPLLTAPSPHPASMAQDRDRQSRTAKIFLPIIFIM